MLNNINFEKSLHLKYKVLITNQLAFLYILKNIYNYI